MTNLSIASEKRMCFVENISHDTIWEGGKRIVMESSGLNTAITTSSTVKLTFSVPCTYLSNTFDRVSFLKLEFTPCKAEQLLRGIELHEKEAQKD